MERHITYVTIAFDIYRNKIIGQINAWQRRGYFCSLLFLERTETAYKLISRNNAVDEDYLDVVIATCAKKRQAIKKLFEYLKKHLNNKDEIIYIRRLGINVIYAGNFFKRIKAKVLYEIPTYPIDSGTTFLRKVALSIELLYFKMYVYPYIFAEPACVQKKIKKLPKKMIEINNSVEVSTKNIKPKMSDEYTFLFFGNLQPWHGLECFLQEVEKYTGSKSLFVKVYSPPTDCYIKLSDKYKNSKKIKFCGKSNSQTIEIHNTNKTIGIGGLAYQTRGADYDTSLKNKDYAAMGIPFIYTLPDLSFPNYKYSFCLKKLNEINLDKIIEWFTSIYTEDMYLQIKEYARSCLTYDVQIEKICGLVEK